MVEFSVDIKEIYDATVVVDLPSDASRGAVLQAAKSKFEEEGSVHTAYNRTMPESDWTIRNMDNGKYL